VRTVATAGHVDHGKSSLVLALTGTDPDRFPEEKARGLTIDLGFAFTGLPSGEEIGFVDVPGHVRFIKNMLAGVGAVDVVMFVVAANEGWMPQSEEHLRIVELLGVRHGVVCLTKADLVDEEMLELARLELDEHLARSSLEDAPVVVCDALTGRGIDDLRSTLDEVLATAPAPADHSRPRLWVDRVFAARGAGTVVTGTLTGGELRVDDAVSVGSPPRPGRIRAIETAHRALDAAAPGTRVALNLAGIEHHAVRRGDAITRPGQWYMTDAVDVALQPLTGSGAFRRRAALQCYVGSGEHQASLRVLDSDRRYGRLRLTEPLPLAPGDRLVLRDSGRGDTVGGAEVLDVAPQGRARDAPARLRLPLGRRLIAAHPWLPVDALGPWAGAGPADATVLADELTTSGAAVRVGNWLVDASALAALRAAAAERVRAHHERAPLESGVDLPALASALRVDPERLRVALDGVDELAVERGIVRDAARRSDVGESPEARKLLDALEAAPFSPPEPASVGAEPGLVRALAREGRVVDLDGIVFAISALDEGRRRVQGALQERGAVTVADVRDLLGSTRKYVLPILQRLDAEGVTRRRGDERFPGPASMRDTDG
jgi:selenocysteine-specific elongation factor